MTKQQSISPLALWALISGIAGFIFSPIGPILAIVLGVMGRKQAKSVSDAKSHKMATAGVWLGAIAIVVQIIAFAIFASTIFRLYERAGNELSDTSKETTSQQESNTTADSQTTTNTLEGTMLQDFTPVENVAELQIIDLQPGTGNEVQASDTVTVDYTGALAKTGVIFQSSKEFGQPISFPLNGVIEGWSKGLVGMKEGGTRRLLIPAAQAYGSQAQQGIPANSDLVFDVTLHKIGQ